MLTSPPILEDSHLRQSPVGTLLLYYWCTFFMRLVFGSFTVAVLVGAFNRANADLLKSKKDQKRLPIGYTSIASKRTGLRRALDFVWHLLTFRHNGHFVPRLEGALNHLVTGGKVNKRVGKNGQEFIELTQQHAVLSPLRRRHSWRRCHAFDPGTLDTLAFSRPSSLITISACRGSASSSTPDSV